MLTRPLLVRQGTVYESQTYAISLSFPPTYPYAAPTVKFETPCFRPSSFRALLFAWTRTDLGGFSDPNVALTGDICLGASP